MKKALAILCFVVLLMTFPCALSENSDITANDDANELTVGTLTWFSGNFFSDIFGTNSSDLDVQRLIHGYNLIYWNNEDSTFSFDPTVVIGNAVSDDANGNRTYTLILNDQLTYSDGSPVTAWDYAFSILLSMDPAVEEVGGNSTKGRWIRGSRSYVDGQKKFLQGVRVFSDYHFTITIDGEFRPFFYEMGYLDWQPYPFRSIMPEIEVKDDGEGVYFSQSITSGLLEKCILDPENGYMTKPNVVSGPYLLDSYDGVRADFSLNPEYIGNRNGSRPQIEKLHYIQTTNESAAAALTSGEIDLLTRCLNTGTIEEAMSLVTYEGNFAMQTYPRNGFSFLMFCCENEKIKDEKTRQAIAMCLDKDTLTADYTGNYGISVDGYYGIGQWMFRLVNGTMSLSSDDEEEQTRIDAETEKLTLESISKWEFDPEKAEQQFESAGWNLNADGQQYISGKGGLRYRKNGDELIPLRLRLVIPESTEIGDILTRTLGDHLQQAGGELEIIPMPFDQMLRMYHHQEERNFEMMFLGSNFNVVFDPAGEFDPEKANLSTNPTGIMDEDLYRSAMDMSMTTAGELLAYCGKWIIFQENWTKALPAIPLYSNAYFDFYTAKLQNYDIPNNISWADAIVESYLGDSMTEEDYFLAEDEMIFED